MSGRHGYSEDLDHQDLAMWRGRVMSAIRGKRGQKLLLDLRDALDAMPEKRLITKDLVREDGDVCALGCVGKMRGVADIDTIDPEAHEALAERFNVAECMVQEIEYVNDEYGPHNQTPAQRWERMRRWCDKNIAKGKEPNAEAK